MKISLCITSYDKDVHLVNNLLPFIHRQTRKPDEIILFCSGLSELNINHKYVKVITESERVMQSRARNICYSLSSGDIVIFFDVDDFPHAQKIELTEYIFNNYKPDFFVHNYSNTMLDLNYHIEIQSSIVKDNLGIDSQCTNIICEDYSVHHAHIAVNRRVFEDISFNEDPKYYRKEDGLFCQDLIRSGYRGIYSPEKLVFYT